MGDVLAVVEYRRGSLRNVSFEFMTTGGDPVGDTGDSPHPAVVGDDVNTFAGELSLVDVDAIHIIAKGDELNHNMTVQAIEALAEGLDPTYALMGDTVSSLSYVPAVAECLDRPLVTDTIDLEGDGGLVVTCEMYAPKVESTVEADADRVAVTVRPGEWDATEESGEPATEAFSFDLDRSRTHSHVIGFEEVGSGDVNIVDADVLVPVNRGAEKEENIGLVQELTDALGATLPPSRPIVGNSWLPKDRQAGQSGKVVVPRFYITVSISDAIQYVTGMRDTENIVTISTDPNAPISDIADYGVIDDLFDVVPEFIKQFG